MKNPKKESILISPMHRERLGKSPNTFMREGNSPSKLGMNPFRKAFKNCFLSFKLFKALLSQTTLNPGVNFSKNLLGIGDFKIMEPTS